MNKRNMKRLIAALRSEAGQEMFNFHYFAHRGEKPLREAYKAGGTCGTTACVAGMAAAIDKRWSISEGYCGTISFNGLEEVEGFAAWAKIPGGDAHQICYPSDPSLWPHGYNTDAAEAADVLEHYLKTGRLERP